MKILLDHNLDRRLKRHLEMFDVSTTHEMGWDDVLNGELLTLAENNGYDALLTADSKIKYQQNMTGRKVAIIVLRAPNNRLATHVEMISDVVNAISNVKAGEVVEVTFTR